MGSMQNGNPVSILNELRSGLKYVVTDKDGLVHDPIFRVEVNVDGRLYCGVGRSKKLARCQAAKEALKSVMQISNNKTDVVPPPPVQAPSLVPTRAPVAVPPVTQASVAVPPVTQAPNPWAPTLGHFRTLNPGSSSTPAPSPSRAPTLGHSRTSTLGPPRVSTLGRSRSLTLGLRRVSTLGLPRASTAARSCVSTPGPSSTQTPDPSWAPTPGPPLTSTAGLSMAPTQALPSQNGVVISNVSQQSVKPKAQLPNVNKGPVMLINELYPNAIYNCCVNEASVSHRFKMTLSIGAEQFIGTGANKKNAKTAAAVSALSKLSQLNPALPLDVAAFKKDYQISKDQMKADHLGRLVQEKFFALVANKSEFAPRKVLAGIVMTRGNDFENAEVISVTTGTKCISGGQLSLTGNCLNDMHAEILAKRCLQLYLYDQLQMLSNYALYNDSIFETRDDNRGYRLKKDVEFHLYISTAPCGDARIFCPHEDNEIYNDPHSNRESRGLLRAKIEVGEGTIPAHNLNTLQTWDGLMAGERLLTMACSDKICRWNVVGLQGALLSHFIEPVYLKSLILGSLMVEGHLQRAIYGRIEHTLEGVQLPFRLNRPDMFLTTSRDIRQPCKTPTYSIIWYKGQEDFEMVNTINGKPAEGRSIICKKELFSKFTEVCGRIRSFTNIEQSVPNYYCDIKRSAVHFTVAKERLFEAFFKANLGNWVRKPIEHDDFDVIE